LEEPRLREDELDPERDPLPLELERDRLLLEPELPFLLATVFSSRLR
jgi:hypothetical protein